MIENAFRYAFKSVPIPHGRALWLYGEPGLASGDVYHPWQSHARLFTGKGGAYFSDIDAIGREYDAVFVCCPKQREETEGLIALALDRSKGFVMAGAANDAGGGRLADMMKAYGLAPHSLSKSKCRIVWTTQAQEADREAVMRGLSSLALTLVLMEGKHWWSVPGLFGWNRIDPGSRLLLESLPMDLAGSVADFGCGYGYLAAMLEARYPALATIDAYDIDARAIHACTRNGGGKVHAIWRDLTTLETSPRYDAVVMNPPFHSGHRETMALGQKFITTAWESLKRGGTLYLVANRHLPYEKIVELAIVREAQGYKIMRGRKPCA